MAKVTMPQLGESVAEGTIGKWLKQPGDHVAKYEPLVEVVTDKVNAEVPSPFEGILREILAEEGAVVPNNAEIASSRPPTTQARAPRHPRRRAPSDAAAPRLPAAEAAPAKDAPAAAPAPAAAAPDRRPLHPAAAQPLPPAPAAAPAPAAGPAGSDERGPAEMAAAVAAPPASADPDARMTPAVRRLLREHELTAAQIVGTGGGGRITREDVLKVVESIRTGGTAPAPAAAAAGPGHGAQRRPGLRPERLVGTASAPPHRARRRPPHPPARRSRSPKAPTKSSCR